MLFVNSHLAKMDETLLAIFGLSKLELLCVTYIVRRRGGKKVNANLPGQVIDLCILPLIWSSSPSTDLFPKKHMAKHFHKAKKTRLFLEKSMKLYAYLYFKIQKSL